MKTYITITDPAGATYGYDGPSVPISHGILFENKVFYGFESSVKLFDSHKELMDLLVHIIAHPSGTAGTHKTLQWSVVK